eukprot:gene8574-10160_t
MRGGFTKPNLDIQLSLPQSKILLQAGLTLFNILCWALPLRNHAFTENRAVLSYANAFAGGIFLMLSFAHLLPEAITTLSNNVPGSGTKAMMYCLVGYMAMFFIEKVAFATHDDATHCSAHSTASQAVPQNEAPDAQHHLQKHNQIEASNKQKSAIALCCAMSVHSFFEAAALGLAADTTSALMMSACIALHQPAESVALLVAFLKAEMPTSRTILWLMSFSMMSMVGVSAGLLVNKLASGDLEAVVTAITAGTFIYVGATEIANEEFEATESKKVRLLRYLCYAGGMLLMYKIVDFSAHYH